MLYGFGRMKAAAHAELLARKVHLLDRQLDRMQGQHGDAKEAIRIGLAVIRQPAVVGMVQRMHEPRILDASEGQSDARIEERRVDAVGIHVGDACVRIEAALLAVHCRSSCRRRRRRHERRPAPSAPRPLRPPNALPSMRRRSLAVLVDKQARRPIAERRIDVLLHRFSGSRMCPSGIDDVVGATHNPGSSRVNSGRTKRSFGLLGRYVRQNRWLSSPTGVFRADQVEEAPDGSGTVLASPRQTPEDAFSTKRGREGAVEIGERRQANVLVLRPVGRIDNLTSGEFQARLLAATTSGPDDIVVDFTAVEYISSAGLRTLMAASRSKPKERRLAVACLNSIVSEIFAISRFSHVVPVFATVEEASAAWQAPPRPQAAVPQAETRPAGPLRVRFWGTRGSLPAPLRSGRSAPRSAMRSLPRAGMRSRPRRRSTPSSTAALPFSVRGTFGGNTSCVELITGGDEYVICDLGTGVREFGNRVVAEHGPAAKRCFNVFLSHLHWDHIMGFPFFPRPTSLATSYASTACHPAMREALHKQQSDPCFPVDFRALPATIEFVSLEPGRTYEIAGFSVTSLKQFHAGDSYGYRFSRGDKTIVYSTDCEHKYSNLDQSYPFIEFYRNADVLIFDAMYSLADTISVKEDWGHSSNVVAVELAQAARVRRLVLFHHEPAYDDRMIEEVFADTVRFEAISRPGHEVEVISAYDGLELEL